ncbi:hypothetical protein [Reyranella sp.]|uniref:hypothetical protein n=1 Tax=Reyranella sp. TaxID=1929291 RepID=UPI003C7A9CE9
MSQHDLTIDNASRTTVRGDIQSALQALGSLMKGSSAPSTLYSGMLWLDDDTPSSTLWTLKQYDGTDWIVWGYVDTVANTFVPASSLAIGGAKGLISGWTSVNNGSDPLHDIDIAAGAGIDTTGVALIQGVALTKRYDASWAAGNGNGGRRGSAANGDWWIHAVLNVSAQTVDYIFDQSRTAPSLPSGYTLFRPIGWFQVASGEVGPFHSYELPGGGLEIARDLRATDVSETIGTARSLVSLPSVPTGISVVATLAVEMTGHNVALDINCPDHNEITPSIGSGLGLAGINIGISMSPGSQFVSGVTAVVKYQQRARTDTSRQLAMQASAAGVGVKAAVDSFEWSRR